MKRKKVFWNFEASLHFMSVGKARLKDAIIRLCLTAIFRLFVVLQNICPPKVYLDAKGLSLPVLGSSACGK